MDSYILHVDGSVTPFKPHGKHFTLDELQTAVKGSIEIIHLTKNKIMIVNEEGKILNLGTNKKASMMGLLLGDCYDLIRGDVVISNIDLLE